jgi:hypothetical protein
MGRVGLGQIAAVLALLLGASQSRGDVLVLRDGSRVETKGPWETKGKLVVFHLPTGALSSLRVDDVDLDASLEVTRQTEAEKRRPPAIEKPKRKAVVVLTDDDVRHVDPEALPAWQRGVEGTEAPGLETTTAETAGEEAIDAGSETQPLRVLAWEQVTDTERGGFNIEGTLRNLSAQLVGNVSMTVTLLDEEGNVVASSSGELAMGTLRPNAQTTFSSYFPEWFSYSSVTFDFRLIPIRYRAQDAEEDGFFEDREEPES